MNTTPKTHSIKICFQMTQGKRNYVFELEPIKTQREYQLYELYLQNFAYKSKYLYQTEGINDDQNKPLS